ncbi:urease accessory protein UreD [Mycolicibacterium phlei]
MTAPAIRAGELGVDAVADASGRTRVASLRQRYPQRVTAPLHCDPDYPTAAMLCVQNPSGGTFSDDDLHTVVRCDTGSHLHLTTQSATQVFAGDGPGAWHHLAFTVATGAVLEYYPQTVIPHTGARFTQRVTVDVADGGVYLGWEALAAGRIGHGERFGYAWYDSAFTVHAAGRVVARDRQVIRPGDAGPPGSLVDDYLATFIAVTPGRSPDTLLERVRAAVADLDGCRGGAGRLPHGAGVFVRLTAQQAPELHRARRHLVDAARVDVLETTREDSEVHV